MGRKKPSSFATFEAVMSVVRFDQFTEENDPYGEYDFGAFELHRVRLFWKIDYYSDERMIFGSRDPSSASETFRLLTIMLASEYLRERLRRCRPTAPASRPLRVECSIGAGFGSPLSPQRDRKRNKA